MRKRRREMPNWLVTTFDPLTMLSQMIGKEKITPSDKAKKLLDARLPR